MTQSRMTSAVESCANVVIGFAVAVATQMIAFPLIGLEVTVEDNLFLGFIFTIVSLLRSYFIRRLFNLWSH